MDETERNGARVEKIGKLMSTIFIVFLLSMFIYGYLGKFVFG